MAFQPTPARAVRPIGEGGLEAPMAYQLRGPEDAPERLEKDEYQLTGNHFGGVLNMWRNFADKRNPANMDLQNHARSDEDRDVAIVEKEI